MTAYCNERWKLYGAWCTALRQVRTDYSAKAALVTTRLALEDHHQTCPICKAHARAMLEMSREAVMPEYEEED